MSAISAASPWRGGNDGKVGISTALVVRQLPPTHLEIHTPESAPVCDADRAWIGDFCDTDVPIDLRRWQRYCVRREELNRYGSWLQYFRNDLQYRYYYQCPLESECIDARDALSVDPLYPNRQVKRVACAPTTRASRSDRAVRRIKDWWYMRGGRNQHPRYHWATAEAKKQSSVMPMAGDGYNHWFERTASWPGVGGAATVTGGGSPKLIKR